MKNQRLQTISEALDAKSLGEYGFDVKATRELAAETGVSGLWNDATKVFPVYVMTSKDGDDWFKSKPSASSLDKIINFIKGSDPKYVNREIIGIFNTLEDAMKVYEAIPVREEK